jgi:multiple sugar transport system permease protein
MLKNKNNKADLAKEEGKETANVANKEVKDVALNGANEQAEIAEQGGVTATKAIKGGKLKKIFGQKEEIALPDLPRNKDKFKTREGIWAWGLLAPTLILFAVFTLIPLVIAIYLSFTDYDLYYNCDFIGWENYATLFSNSVKGTDFWKSILNVLLFVVMSVPLSVVSSFLVANLVNSKLKGVKIYRFLYYLPAVTSGVATAFCWRWLLNYNHGLINELIVSLGGERVDWLNSYSYLPLFTVAIISTWGGLGGNMLIYLAALKGVNPDVYEAAQMDGANAFQRLIHITLPSVRTTTFFIVTMSIIGAFQLFDTVYLVIGTGSIYTKTPVLLIYTMAFGGNGQAGYASAMSVMLFIIIMVVTFVVQKFMKGKD